jgi:hypothetical protein
MVKSFNSGMAVAIGDGRDESWSSYLVGHQPAATSTSDLRLGSIRLVKIGAKPKFPQADWSTRLTRW